MDVLQWTVVPEVVEQGGVMVVTSDRPGRSKGHPGHGEHWSTSLAVDSPAPPWTPVHHCSPVLLAIE